MARSTSHALFARLSLNGDFVEERSVRSGVPLQVGFTPGSPPAKGDASMLALPLPEGVPYVARALWTTPSSCAVQDSSGAVHVLEPGRDVVLQVGPLEVRLYLVELVPVIRREPISARGSIAWLAIVAMATALTSQVFWIGERRCELAFATLGNLSDVWVPLLVVFAPLVASVVALFVLLTADDTKRALPALGLPILALLVPLGYRLGGLPTKPGPEFLAEEFASCFPKSDEGSQAFGPQSAEYLARLLKNDVEGEDQGVVENRIERPEAARELADKDIFMPAGSEGPVTKMGGAEEVAPDPVRTIVTEDPIAVTAKSTDPVTLDAPNATPIERPAGKEDPADGAADGLEVAETEPGEGVEPPAEDKEGWGFPAWYDEKDKAMDQFEIDLMLRAAQHRLRIDPNDPAALSILSYYQYLAQDFESAQKTYDKFIELFPDDPAGYNNKALVYKRLLQYQKEESLYRVALALSPDDVTALNNLGVNLAHQGRYEEALAVMKELERLDPDDPYADLHRSKIQAEMGKDDEALAYLEQALRGMAALDTLHHIEFRQDIRLDPSFEKLRDTYRFRAILDKYYGKDSPLEE